MPLVLSQPALQWTEIRSLHAQVGEMMDARYEVFASNGKGVFSTVVRARDTARRDETGKHPEVGPPGGGAVCGRLAG